MLLTFMPYSIHSTPSVPDGDHDILPLPVPYTQIAWMRLPSRRDYHLARHILVLNTRTRHRECCDLSLLDSSHAPL